ncbi:MAG TPA: hypothetical protein VKH63_22860 [Candidatus Acidoferrum sp.]|jgi:hypothetical protein|nr:hypothetical protein [Candidatus Acidoferrum sp.]
MPSEDGRSKKIPLPRSVKLPSAKTSGTCVNLLSAAENIQKQPVAHAAKWFAKGAAGAVAAKVTR